MGRSGKGVDDNALAKCSPEVIKDIQLMVYQKEEDISKRALMRTLERVNKDLGRDDKVKDGNLSDLVLKLCGAAEAASGMYRASEWARKETKEKLDSVLDAPSRDDKHAAIEVVYKLGFQKILLESAERRLKELQEGIKGE